MEAEGHRRLADAIRRTIVEQSTGRGSTVIVSDAELNEGSTWGAAMFAAQHRLENLVLLLDLGDVEGKLSAFGWSVETPPGHDQEALE